MTLDECRALCRRAKYLGEHCLWADRPNHVPALRATAALLDQHRVALPGVYFQGEYHPRRYGTYHSYGILHRSGGSVRRVFMLEVMPPHVLSHRDTRGDVFGPHYALGDARDGEQVVAAVRRLADLDNIEQWIRRFQRHAQVYDDGEFRLESPFARELFQ